MYSLGAIPCVLCLFSFLFFHYVVLSLLLFFSCLPYVFCGARWRSSLGNRHALHTKYRTCLFLSFSSILMHLNDDQSSPIHTYASFWPSYFFSSGFFSCLFIVIIMLIFHSFFHSSLRCCFSFSSLIVAFNFQFCFVQNLLILFSSPNLFEHNIFTKN